MEWTEIKIEVNSSDIDKASDIANMTVPYGIYIEDYSNMEQEVLEIAKIDLIDEELLQKDRQKAIVHIYISPEESPQEAVLFLSERYNSENIKHNISCENVEDEDWLHNWKKYFKPMKVGEKLLIKPTWVDEYEQDARKILHLDPGLAFGTGTHETTRLCLVATEKYIKENATVLDVGCGSGILSVASVLLGAKEVLGIDIDELAVKTANENAILNGVSNKITSIHGNLTDKVTNTYDIVLANIVADAIIMLSKDIGTFMHENSIYIMSGIVDIRIDEVLNEVTKNFEIIEKIEENGWYCLVAKKI